MSICRDCISYDRCQKNYLIQVADLLNIDIDALDKGRNKGKFNIDDDTVCEYFKDKAKVLEPPVVIGDTVWAISSTGSLFEYTVNGIHQFEDKHFMFGAFRIREDGKKVNPTWQDSELNKIVFTTKDEADKALGKVSE